MNQEVLLLVQKCAHTFSFYDVQTGAVLKHIRLPEFPHEFVVDSKNRFAYVGHYGIETSSHEGEGGCSVFVIDLERAEHVRTLSIWPFRRPHGLAMDDQDRLYVLSEGNSTLLIFDQPHLRDVPDRAIPSGGYKSHLVAMTRNGETAFALNLLSNTITRLKPQDPTIAPLPMQPGSQPEGNCFSRDERTLYVTTRGDNSIVAVDVETLKVTHRGRTGADPTRIYRDRQDRLYVTNYGEQSLSVFSPQLEQIRRVELDSTAIAMSLHPTRDLAFVTLKDQRVGMLDLNTWTFERYFETLLEPDVSQVIVR
ncbi:NHL repeat containing protein [Pseudomonas sp. FH4]|jgi:YVTN family beta-propeller protein|uniref:40-residue YVTN family beta-propeller repeat-containing protein n=1 Tax=Pseudomonas brenneri TaxID=129817 RepID=A0A5B2UP81_9PSED|nr:MULTISPECIES: YncE family protein [Pseudomonas]MBU0939344.1 YncE family protein [Gammaproteobacteria bacterium]ETK14675.1 NHL repeat containing protein [Pseudomonas sp. FH4]KAA2227675.1 YncE family protein [Pseudomonas brenneri]KAA6176747.1 YncE family protein [Pseudomonas marginalis]MBF8004690.1 YncE family protein [Pseudomonas brenneri]